MTRKSGLALSMLASVSLAATAAVAQGVSVGEQTFTTQLTGPAEAPVPGDPAGSGSATVTVNFAEREVCYELTVSGIDTPTAAHIHKGVAGVAGPVVVPLETPEDGTSEGCEQISAGLAAQILARPSRFYVNVHNEDFPAGAVRGQLG